ncbi:winged helix-turn-helix transcriptional regulator [Actinacidiphila rubida]|uniref:Transcriptional regulator, HxlR family n=1 Tax=Actinacidiphila rubida TaxID=310780 RepID=A0A1H8TRM9_9ACTN|nr:helix-turn-helix domain-containing protein [Actinacidiphila rubida]SEO93183.1 transcriptional regulator, HxlR family [Actinacidiphila rubida]
MRSYEQTCLVARSLDIVGERWTLLIVRELALGPRRYSDLLGVLSGMGTSLLASRLKHLEERNVVRRTTLPGPGQAAAYELTERGEGLFPVIAGLAEWGAGLGEPSADHTDRVEWSVVAMRLTSSKEAARFTTLTELAIEDETLWLQGDGERVRVGVGSAPLPPGLRLTSGKKTFYALAQGRLTVDDAVADERLDVHGELDEARLFFQLFSLPGGQPSPA